MRSRFHAGELAVQEQAGVRDKAARVGGSIHNELPPAAHVFLAQRRYVVLATAGADGRPWASLLTGPPGFASVLDPGTIRVDAQPLPGDPLADTLATSTFAGLLAIDLATRRRMRANGRLRSAPGEPIRIALDQVYSNCPKYIQRRDVERGEAAEPARAVEVSGSLNERRREWIRRADTFFLATVNPDEGADASHRGGMSGFVRVEGNRLTWPDYAGNMMYNTLGNIAMHPRAGVLVPDFGSGRVLLLTGRASIDWEPGQVGAIAGAERLVDLEVEEAVEIAGALPEGGRGVEYSPFNPPL